MVSQQNVTEAAGSGVLHRGFVSEEAAANARMEYPQYSMYHRPFWGPIIGGSLFVISLFILSGYLMLGCHVGITSAGVIAFGWGASVWMWVTACIAFYFGAMIAGGGSVPSSNPWLRGAVLWGLTIPLMLLIGSLITYGASAAVNFSHVSLVESSYGMTSGAEFSYFWSTFIGLGLALCFSFIGGGNLTGFRGYTGGRMAEDSQSH